jgi:FkbM family methyltransferase
VKVRRIIYETSLNFRRFLWKVSGGRRIRAFGENFRVTPNTIFPTYRKFPLPKGHCLSEIVRYTDFVQLHSVCSLLMKLEKPTVIEIGANHGAYAIIAGKFAKKMSGRVIAIEPDTESFNVLKDNVRMNNLQDTVACEQIAVLGKSGLANFESCGGQSHVTENDTGHIVKVTTLRELIKKHEVKSVDILIIDVEGAELCVLKGHPWESVKVDNIFCELHPYAWKDFGYSGEDLKDFLRSHNFRCFDMYFREFTSFQANHYIGPTVFLQGSYSVNRDSD